MADEKQQSGFFKNLVNKLPYQSLDFNNVINDLNPKYNQFQDVTLSAIENYHRLTVPEMIWVGFQGLDEDMSILLNIANIEHSPEETDQKELEEINFDWSK